MSPDDVNPEWVEKAARAMADDWNPDRDPILTVMFRDYAASALAAVLPDAMAEAWGEGWNIGNWGIRDENGEVPNPYEEGKS